MTTAAWPVTCEEFSAETDHGIPRHAHEKPHVCLVFEGTLIERDRAGRHRMQGGHARISAAGDEHDLEIGDGRPLFCLILLIARECFDDPQAALPAERRYAAGPGVRELGRRLWGELRNLDDTSPLSLEMLALEAAVLGGCSPDIRIEATPNWLERVRERVRDDIRSIPTLAELACGAGVSRAHLARTFRARYGYTVGQFVRHQRLETARRLILTTEQPLAAVAYEAGFADQSHMTRQIGVRFGHPPGRLRSLSGSA
ncbi:MAG: AraC family transcriptional regulator [Gemmatimonadota bacterium]